MGLFYNIIVDLAAISVRLFGGLHKKTQKGQEGRSRSLNILAQELKETDKVIWMHCSSLGEYEQGLPFFEPLKKQYQEHKFVMTFFSPSGYEIRKNNPIADVVVYLPLDQKSVVKKFLDLTHPELVVFVKYDLWPNYLLEIKRRNITSILISALFRPSQAYFKFYGGWLKQLLFTFDHIFTQDTGSKVLLNSIGYNNVTVSGDTRFDRVGNQINSDNTLDFIAEFKNNKTCVVAGSTWPEDEVLLIDYINNSKDDVKFVIAPHNMDLNQIKSMTKQIQKPTVLYSNYKNETLVNKSVFVVDTIGLLTKIYNYADIAYIGGAMGGTGLHNTLEAATFGVPIVIGKNYKNFPEAKAMQTLGGLISISNYDTLHSALDEFVYNLENRTKSGQINKQYVEDNKGASEIVMNELQKIFKK
ncbi:MAG: glycosyltransferase N-terminal domain-containing protein [Flavobacteriaceae bacterium]|nr:glycosyltransferase N-terminal domain-containing protein [Flavobacteriaceae bacterium]MDG2499420.1 glycosyltransferase N-terminal domain-containing protein [Flavobacteriaceae bacterium]